MSVQAELDAFVSDPSFPCLGAKGALRQGGCHVHVYGSLGACDAAPQLAADLAEFGRLFESSEDGLTAFAASFPDGAPAKELEFEAAMWRELQALHEHDASRGRWAADSSDDPDDPDFAFSFDERSYFIIGLHPLSSRVARRFHVPTLVFNPRSQFSSLRSAGKFDKLKRAIRRRDLDLQGTANPNLADFGESSEARQYSGREVEQGWKCPFHRARE